MRRRPTCAWIEWIAASAVRPRLPGGRDLGLGGPPRVVPAIAPLGQQLLTLADARIFAAALVERHRKRGADRGVAAGADRRGRRPARS